MKEKIDFVITWVDGNDPDWQKERNKYLSEKIDIADNQNGECRYRDMGTLRYWFRAVEKYAPWVNKIHFITCGHLPEWLNTKHEKLNIVKHSDYIPAEYLPTFNTRVIELNLHRIEILNEHFVLFNDDMFLNDNVSEDFFFKNGLPRGSAILCPIFPKGNFDHAVLNNIILLNKNFDFRTSIRKNFRKFINIKYGLKNIRNLILGTYVELCGFKEFHSISNFLKSTFIEIWEKERNVLDKTSRSRFRNNENVTQWLIKNWQFMKGQFEPISPKYTEYYGLGSAIADITKDIKENKHKVICINDTDMNYDFEKAKSEVIRAFEEKFPRKCSYEL